MIKRFAHMLFCCQKRNVFLFSSDPKNYNAGQNVDNNNKASKNQGERNKTQQQHKFGKQKKKSIGWMLSRLLFWNSIAILGYNTYLVHQHQKNTPVEDQATALPGFITAAKYLYEGINQTTQFFTKPPLQKLLPDPPNPQQHPKTLVLNLSGTLVQNQKPTEKGIIAHKRPGLHQFLKKMSQIYEIIIFSDQDQRTIDTLASHIDPRRSMIAGCFGNQCMVFTHGKYIKDLKYLNRDLNKVIVVDLNKQIVKKHKQNVIVLPEFKGDENDRQIVKLISLLQYLAHPQITDIRKALYKLGQNPFQAYQQISKSKQQKSNKKYINKNIGFFYPKK